MKIRHKISRLIRIPWTPDDWGHFTAMALGHMGPDKARKAKAYLRRKR